VWQAALAAYRVQTANSTAAVTIGEPTPGTQVASASGGASSMISSIFHSGEGMVKMLTNGATAGANYNGQVNPLIRMKNTGDYAMGIAESALAATVALSVVKEEKDGWSFMGLAAKAGNVVTGVGDAFSGVYKAVYPYVFLMILAFFMFGVTLSVYIPLVPFIIWFGACLNWLLVVAEGVVAAPLWAMTHLGETGEGLGQATRHGYLFFLNMCMRPFLMVIGFFIGGGILTVGGTFLMSAFTIAVANAQYDSVTGLFSILGFFWVFVQLCLLTVHTSFNVILLVPDQVIAWAGGQATARLGYDTHDQASHGFNQGREKAGATHERGGDKVMRATPPGGGSNGMDGG
jgi:conjugal transfer/type IV secretion protein DotA/TraY